MAPLRARLAYDLAPVHRVALAGRRGRVRIWYELGRGEEPGVNEVRVERGARVGPSWTMRTPAWARPWMWRSCPLGCLNQRSMSRLSSGSSGSPAPANEARREAPHHAGHVDADWIPAA